MKIRLQRLEGWISCEEAGSLIGKSRQRVYQLIEAGELEARLISDTVVVVSEESVSLHRDFKGEFKNKNLRVKLVCISDSGWEGYITVGKVYDGVRDGVNFRVRTDHKASHLMEPKFFKEVGKTLKVSVKPEFEYMFNAVIEQGVVYDAELTPDDTCDVTYKQGKQPVRVKTKYLQIV